MIDKCIDCGCDLRIPDKPIKLCAVCLAERKRKMKSKK